MNKLFPKIIRLYRDSTLWVKLYLAIRLRLTPFEKVAGFVPKNGKVYDLGCGYGIFSNIMNFKSPGRKIVGIDLSRERIAVARKTIGGRRNIEFVCDDLKNINLEKCGTIVIYDVLHHIGYKDQEILVNECYRKLGREGLLIIKDNDALPRWKFLWNYLHEILTRLLLITKSGHLSFRTKEDFLKMLFKAGFVVRAVNIPTSLPYPFILYLCRKTSRKRLNQGFVFINPPLSLEERYGAIAKGGRNAPPLGLCSLAAVVRSRGYKVHLIDACVLGYSTQKVVKEILDISPKFVGITASTLAIKSAMKLAAEIKRVKETITVLIGGPHVTALPKETLKECLAFDFGIVGEGEETLIEFLSAFENHQNFHLVEGLVFRERDGIIVNQGRDFINNLDSLPIPAWDLLPSLSLCYRSSPQSFDRLPSTSLVTSRGCPYQCTFCDRSVFGNVVRGYSPPYVLKMIKILTSQYGIKHILFDDDTFTVMKERLTEICRLIIQKKVDLTWTCLARVDCVDEQTLKLMKKAGCWQILFGIESGNQVIIDKLKKGITLEQVRQAIEMTKRVGIRSKGFFILGTPFETKETAEETIKFMKRIYLDDFHMTYFTPFPGTEIYSQVKGKSNFEENWGKMNEWSPIFVPPKMNREELIFFSKKAFREFYFRPKIVISYFKAAVFSGNLSPLSYGVSALVKYLISNI